MPARSTRGDSFSSRAWATRDGHLDKLLPARAKVRKVKHHAALPYDELPAFMTASRAQDGVVARALEYLILTAARTGEVSRRAVQRLRRCCVGGYAA